MVHRTVCILVLFVICMLVQLTVSKRYRTPNKAVGKRLSKEYFRFDRRYPFEFGFDHYYQGDILLPAQENRVVIRREAARWLNATVPYKIAGNFSSSEMKTLKSAMNQFHSKTCVRFVECTDQPYFITISNKDTGCYSYVGFHANNLYHQVNLQTPYCLYSVGTPVHELLHSLGGFHEFSRPDRDDYVTFNRSALRQEYQTDQFFENNFEKLPSDQVLTFNISYDYGSVMHYSRYAGAASPNSPVMINKKPWVGDFGSETGLKQSDIAMVNAMYCKKIM
ncbi:hatching enzyme 1.2-like [Toxorhynchites rutilus septentrionalis]|uniref:hatching enzyme 1.2-like n=1 Tax=Toxorhynchites rutilus septentrionalis TaxID=329112 RepID=UPI00247AF311|nr:hatching enzyme 1.2-like [Toxorhynchites rutilus septentrionalis]